jgi:FMN phosphatase YigB (HAD superfamily)
MHELTATQIAELRLEPGRPLVICDVDEVIVHFTREFEEFLETHGMWLDTSTWERLNACVRRKAGKQLVGAQETERIVHLFFAERTRHMKAIPGAVEAILDISKLADVVMLTNLPHEAGQHRRENLAAHGVNFPVVTNSGPKGPAIREIASKATAPVVFIDDSPGFITSAFHHAPHVHLIHFVQDERFAQIFEPLDFVSLRTGDWLEAAPHVMRLIAR